MDLEKQLGGTAVHPGEKLANLGCLRKLGFPKVAGIGRQPVLREPARVAEALEDFALQARRAKFRRHAKTAEIDASKYERRQRQLRGERGDADEADDNRGGR